MVVVTQPLDGGGGVSEFVVSTTQKYLSFDVPLREFTVLVAINFLDIFGEWKKNWNSTFNFDRVVEPEIGLAFKNHP